MSLPLVDTRGDDAVRVCRDRCSGAATVDDDDGAAGVPRASAEEVVEGAAAKADGEYSEPDLGLTGFQQSVDQKKNHRDTKHKGSVRIVFFRCDSWCPLRSCYNAQSKPNVGGSTKLQTQGDPNQAE